jgi:hypothetical protein
MTIRDLIPWIRDRDAMPRAAETDNATVYIVKWIPKDQDAIIDHSTHYGDPSPAMQFAVNVLQLSPKRIWIEDGKGIIHTDHETILDHLRGSANEQPAVTFPAPNGQHEAEPVDAVLSQVDAPVEEPILTATDLVDSGPTPNEDKRVVLSKVKLPLNEPSTVSQRTVQVRQVPTHQDQQEHVNMVLAEIQAVLAEPPPTKIQQGNSENGNFDARSIVETKSPNLLTANSIRLKQNEPEMSASVAQEVEVLLGISTSSEAQ